MVNSEYTSGKTNSKASFLARGVISVFDHLVDLVVMALILVVLAYAAYSIWDTNQIYTSSDSTVYETYKPTAEKDSPTFAELQKINPDVCAWISVYGTGIDYPVVQGENNDEYLNKTVTGDFALGGSIFLDSTNNNDFSEFNTVVYGHHMEKSEMFGDLDKFDDKSYFDEHQYGSLYYGGALHGLTVFAMVDGDAYDFTLYNPHVDGMSSDSGDAASVNGDSADSTEENSSRGNISGTDTSAETNYISYITSKAKYTRDIGVKPGDHIVMLSTCASGTNERYVLFARIEDNAEANPYEDNSDHSVKRSVAGLSASSVTQEKLILYTGIAAVVMLILYFLARRYEKQKYQREDIKKQMGDPRGE